jgi:hypothetical protein
MAITSAPLQYVSAVLNCSARLRGCCKRRTTTRNRPKLKSDTIRDCCGESVRPNSEDLLDVVGIAEPLDLSRQGCVCQVMEKFRRVIIRHDDVTTLPFSPPHTLIAIERSQLDVAAAKQAKQQRQHRVVP